VPTISASKFHSRVFLGRDPTGVLRPGIGHQLGFSTKLLLYNDFHFSSELRRWRNRDHDLSLFFGLLDGFSHSGERCTPAAMASSSQSTAGEKQQPRPSGIWWFSPTHVSPANEVDVLVS